MWQELCPKSRKRLAPRFDKNVRKGQRAEHDQENQAPTWKRQRRNDVERQLAEAAREPLQLSDVWTEKRDKEPGDRKGCHFRRNLLQVPSGFRAGLELRNPYRQPIGNQQNILKNKTQYKTQYQKNVIQCI